MSACAGDDDTTATATPPPSVESEPPAPPPSGSSSTSPAATSTITTIASPSTADAATTAPPTSAAPTTAPPSTAPSSTAPSSTAPTTTVLRDAADLMAWPEPPPRPTPDELPYYLPAGPIDGVLSSARRADEEPASTFEGLNLPDYRQAWLGADDARLLTISTSMTTPVTTVAGADEVEIAPWDAAYVQVVTVRPSETPAAVVTLLGGDGLVLIEATGFTRDEALDIARSLRRSEGEAGWRPAALPSDPVLLHEGWNAGAIGRSSHSIFWYGESGAIAELAIEAGRPDAFANALRAGVDAPDVTLADVSSRQVLLVDQDTFAGGGPTYAVWSPAAETTVRFGLVGDTEDTLAIVRDIVEVDQATWNDVAPPLPGPPDGCPGIVC